MPDRRLPRRGIARAVLALAAGLAGPAARANDLLDAWRLARGGDPVLAQAGAQRASAHAQADVAAAALRPQAAALATWNRERASGAGQPVAADSRTEVSLSVNQVLFDAGLAAQRGSARALAQSQDETVRAATQALCLRVAEAYLGMLQAADALATAQANEDAYEQQVRQSEARVRLRLAAQVDVDQARTYRELARAATLSARQALADARGALAEITGVEPGALHPLREALPLDPPTPADPEAWARRAAEDPPAVLAARWQLRAAERDIDAARAGHLPTLDAGFGLGRPAWTPAAAGGGASGRLNASVGLTLTVPLFAGGATQARVRDAVARRDAAADVLEQQRRAAVRAAREAWRAVVEGAGRVEATRASVEAARRALAATRTGYDVGTRTVTDLLLSIQSLGAAQDASSQARHDLVLARLRLAQAAGVLDEADLAAVDALLVS